MKDSTRLYLVTTDAGEKYLVDASNPAQAIRHVARNMFSARVASPKDVAGLVGDGVRVEYAKAEAEAA